MHNVIPPPQVAHTANPVSRIGPVVTRGATTRGLREFGLNDEQRRRLVVSERDYVSDREGRRLAFGHHEDRTPTHSYAATREDAMAAFATSWRRGVKTGKEERTPGDLPSLRLWLTLIRRSLRALQFKGQLQPLLGEISEHWGPRWRVIRERQSLFKMPD